METIKLKILDEAGHTLMTCDADTAVSLVYTNEYHPGDRVALEIDHPGQYCVIQFEDTMPEALVYVSSGRSISTFPSGSRPSPTRPRAFRAAVTLSGHGWHCRKRLPPGGIWPSTAMTSMATPVFIPTPAPT